MYLIADTTLVNPPTYLVSGDLAVQLQDAVSVANLRGVGVPLVQMSPQEITSITQLLAP